MFGKVICIPFIKGGYLDFWGFVKDDGRPLIEGAFRTIVHTTQDNFMDDLKKILIQRKRDIMSDYYRLRKHNAAQRWYRATKALYQAIRDNETESKIEHTTDL